MASTVKFAIYAPLILALTSCGPELDCSSKAVVESAQKIVLANLKNMAGLMTERGELSKSTVTLNDVRTVSSTASKHACSANLEIEANYDPPSSSDERVVEANRQSSTMADILASQFSHAITYTAEATDDGRTYVTVYN